MSMGGREGEIALADLTPDGRSREESETHPTGGQHGVSFNMNVISYTFCRHHPSPTLSKRVSLGRRLPPMRNYRLQTPVISIAAASAHLRLRPKGE